MFTVDTGISCSVLTEEKHNVNLMYANDVINIVLDYNDNKL